MAEAKPEYVPPPPPVRDQKGQIGRASCRERV